MTRLSDWNPTRLRWVLGVFFLALVIPTALLINRAYTQLRWESFHLYQQQAVELAARIDRDLRERIHGEEARSSGDYEFVVVSGDPNARYLQLSPLAAWPPTSVVPGLIGHFQVAPDGVLTTPSLPQDDSQAARYGVSAQELLARRALQARIENILGENRLISRRDRDADKDNVAGSAGLMKAQGMAREDKKTDALSAADESYARSAAPEPQSFDDAKAKQNTQSYLGRVESLKLEQRFRLAAPPVTNAPQESVAVGGATSQPRQARKERAALAESPVVAQAPAAAAETASGPDVAADTAAGTAARIRIFETEIEPLQLRLLDSGQFVLYRSVWRNGQRYIQGALLERDALLNGLIGAALRESVLAPVSDLVVAWQGEVLSVYSNVPTGAYTQAASQIEGELLYRNRLSAPLDELELVFSLKRLPAGPGAVVIYWLAAILAVVLCGGFLLLYRLAMGQLALVRQQQDFVAAVSHELKTPLTSIRMYSEMLREGWASEEKKRSYYDYIHDESERLSRLIGNVLRLARMTRNDATLEARTLGCGQLLAEAQAKLASQVERAGFVLELNCDEAATAAQLNVDTDAFSQILINLVDNALKFASHSEPRRIELSCRATGDGAVQFGVRDYGPGVPPAQIRKIFGLFYRAGNELTRETVGTGIGLALVKQLTEAMGGTADVVNREPGAEFRLRFPVAQFRGQFT